MARLSAEQCDVDRMNGPAVKVMLSVYDPGHLACSINDFISVRCSTHSDPSNLFDGPTQTRAGSGNGVWGGVRTVQPEASSFRVQPAGKLSVMLGKSQTTELPAAGGGGVGVPAGTTGTAAGTTALLSMARTSGVRALKKAASLAAKSTARVGFPNLVTWRARYSGGPWTGCWLTTPTR